MTNDILYAYNSYSNTTDCIRYSGVPGTTRNVRVSHIERDAMVLQNGTLLATPRDKHWTVLLEMGYKPLVSFLEDLDVTAKPSSPPFPASASPLPVSPNSVNVQTDYYGHEEGEEEDEETHDSLPLLFTTTRYIHPHHQHIFASSPLILLVNALAVISPPMWIAHALLGYA